MVWFARQLCASTERIPCSLPVSNEAAGEVLIAWIARPLSFYMIPPNSFVVSSGMGLIDLPLHASSQSPVSFSRVAWLIIECACRTSTFLSCALRKHRRSSGSIPPSHASENGRPTAATSVASHAPYRQISHGSWRNLVSLSGPVNGTDTLQQFSRRLDWILFMWIDWLVQ